MAGRELATSALDPSHKEENESEPSPPTGKGKKLHQVGDYELLEEIGRGGMGVVYKARQISAGQLVAVKINLGGELASEAEIKRFKAEAKAVAGLRHPNIVAIHEVGVHDGEHYFSMDLISGPNLAQLARSNPLPPRRAARYVQIVAEAVHYAHQHNILHRDIKPSNVLLDVGDQPRIMDFGLAKRLDTESSLSTGGQAVGTPAYMPPEQFDSKFGGVGPYSDVYSLGATLHYLLTGRPPFQGNLVDVLEQVRSVPPPFPHVLNAAVPCDLETICLKCLRKEPMARYCSAAALAEDLRRWQSGESISARPLRWPVRIWQWCRRKPAC